MPVYNSKFLRIAVDSILQQTYEDFEFIIIDDGSDPWVGYILDSYSDSRIVLLRNRSQKGVTYSLNRGLQIAQGEVFARHDSDDISLPTRFAEQVGKFTGQVGLVDCWGQSIDKNGRKNHDHWIYSIQLSNSQVREQLPKRNCLLHSGAMFSREVFETIGYYDPSMIRAQDYNYWLRLTVHFDIHVCPKKLVEKRQHPEMVWGLHRDVSYWLKQARERANTNPVISYPFGPSLL